MSNEREEFRKMKIRTKTNLFGTSSGIYGSTETGLTPTNAKITEMKKEREVRFHEFQSRIYPQRKQEEINEVYGFDKVSPPEMMHESTSKKVSKLDKISLQGHLNQLRNDKLLFSLDSAYQTNPNEPIVFFDHREQQVAHPKELKSENEIDELRKPSDWEKKNMERLSKNFVYDKYADFLYYKSQTTGINPDMIKEKLMKSQSEIKKIQLKNQKMNPQNEMKQIIRDAKKKMSTLKAQRPKEVREKEALLEENAKLKSQITALKEKGMALQNENTTLSKKCQIARLEIDNFFAKYDAIRMKLKGLQDSKVILNKNLRENSGLGYLKELQDRFNAYELLLVECKEYKELLEKIHMEKSFKSECHFF